MKKIFSPWRMISGPSTIFHFGFHHWIMIFEIENAEWVGCGCGVTSQDERENDDGLEDEYSKRASSSLTFQAVTDFL